MKKVNRLVNRNYINGRAYEYRTMRKLEKEGYTCFRMAGSHTKIDIIAMQGLAFSPATESVKEFLENLDGEFKPVAFQIRFIQCKKDGYLNPKERRDKAALEKKLHIKIEVM